MLAGTVKAAQDDGVDVVLCDTSGRLHTNWRLMDELQVVVQDIDGVQKGAPHETLLVLDGSTGLNMMNQVQPAPALRSLCASCWDIASFTWAQDSWILATSSHVGSVLLQSFASGASVRRVTCNSKLIYRV